MHKPLVYLLRHGRIKGFETRRFIGTTDILLDHTGIGQAFYWKEAFKSIKPEIVFSSELRRCRHTAGIITPKAPVNLIPAINEIHLGEWENRSFSEIRTEFPEAFEKRGCTLDTFRPPNGESFSDLARRAVPFFLDCIRCHPGALIITHAGVIRVILSHIQNAPIKQLFNIKLTYGQLYVIGTV